MHERALILRYTHIDRLDQYFYASNGIIFTSLDYNVQPFQVQIPPTVQAPPPLPHCGFQVAASAVCILYSGLQTDLSGITLHVYAVSNLCALETSVAYTPIITGRLHHQCHGHRGLWLIYYCETYL